MSSHSNSQTPLKVSELPKQVFQDDFTASKGNALQAAVASIFDKALDEVPNFITMKCGYEQGIREYVKDYYNLEKTKIDSLGKFNDNHLGKICIIRGKSPRGDFGHVVVGKLIADGKFEMIHDPHPDNTFLDDAEPFGWYMIFEEI